MANDLYEYIIRKCKEEVRDVERGEFGAMMHVELLNEGPFTIILDSAEMGWAQKVKKYRNPGSDQI